MSSFGSAYCQMCATLNSVGPLESSPATILGYTFICTFDAFENLAMIDQDGVTVWSVLTINT